MLQPHLTTPDLAMLGAVLMFAMIGFGTACWAIVEMVSEFFED